MRINQQHRTNWAVLTIEQQGDLNVWHQRPFRLHQPVLIPPPCLCLCSWNCLLISELLREEAHSPILAYVFDDVRTFVENDLQRVWRVLYYHSGCFAKRMNIKRGRGLACCIPLHVHNGVWQVELLQQGDYSDSSGVVQVVNSYLVGFRSHDRKIDDVQVETILCSYQCLEVLIVVVKVFVAGFCPSDLPGLNPTSLRKSLQGQQRGRGHTTILYSLVDACR
jgi:hypothetical protein